MHDMSLQTGLIATVTVDKNVLLVAALSADIATTTLMKHIVEAAQLSAVVLSRLNFIAAQYFDQETYYIAFRWHCEILSVSTNYCIQSVNVSVGHINYCICKTFCDIQSYCFSPMPLTFIEL